MDIFKKKIEHKDIQSLKESSWHRLSRDPFVDWIFILALSITLVALALVIAIWKYVDTGIAVSGGDTGSSMELRKPIDTNELKRFADSLTKRVGTTRAIKSGVYERLGSPY